jgi:hypothetical protein
LIEELVALHFWMHSSSAVSFFPPQQWHSLHQYKNNANSKFPMCSSITIHEQLKQFDDILTKKYNNFDASDSLNILVGVPHRERSMLGFFRGRLLRSCRYPLYGRSRSQRWHERERKTVESDGTRRAAL